MSDATTGQGEESEPPSWKTIQRRMAAAGAYDSGVLDSWRVLPLEKADVLATIRAARLDVPEPPAVPVHREAAHSNYDEAVDAFLRYAVAGGEDLPELAAALLAIPSPLDWGWYA